MQINSNNINQTNFKGVEWEAYMRKFVGKSVKEVVNERITPKHKGYVEKMEERLKNSPITLRFGFADCVGDRFDAQVFCRKGSDRHFSYLEEKKWENILRINPIKFLKRAEKELRKIESEMGLS